MLSCIGFLYYWGHYEPRTWGDEGYLEVEISLDKTTISENESFTVTVTIENNWTSMLRVMPIGWIGEYGSIINVTDENGTQMNWHGSISGASLPPDNSDLVVLEEGERLTKKYRYSTSTFNLEAGHTYIIQGPYSAPNHSSMQRLPLSSPPCPIIFPSFPNTRTIRN